MIKILHYDKETTGKDSRIHGVHQFAGGIEIDGKIEEEFDFKIRPFPTAIIDQEALKISGVTVQQIMAYENSIEVLRKFCNIMDKYCDASNPLDKFYLSGYRVSYFDNGFLSAFFEQNGSGKFQSYFYNSAIDTEVLAANALRYERGTMANFKLETVAKRFNVDVDSSKQHDAVYDWKLSRAILQAINKNM